MGKQMQFDYYYGIEAEQFSFYRVPRLLIKDERFKGLSSDAKLLYGLMLDRMSLSMKNGWLDEENRAYIIYTLDNVMEDLGCAKATCVKIMKELDSDNGIGLIEKKRRGLGKPDIIYVKNFATIGEAEEETPANADVSTEVQDLNLKSSKSYTSRSSETELQEVQKADFQKSKNFTSRSTISELAEVQKADPNYTNYNHTNQSNIDRNYINPINQSGSELEGEIDVMEDVNAYMEIIKENIEYEHHMKYGRWQDKGLYEELYEVICEIVCVKHTFNFVVSIMYSQLFNLLCDKADDVYNGRLPVHVRMLLDEFANIGQIPQFEKLIATIRSREISASIILQSKSQLKAIYRDNADTIEGNCDTTLFLGGKEKTTLKELAEVLGKETIDLYNTSDTRGTSQSYGLNYQKTGKELMSQDEIAVMDGGKCIMQLRGVRPFFSDKFDITKHKRYKELSDYDKKNAFDMEQYVKHLHHLKVTEKTKVDEAFECGEISPDTTE